MFNTYLWEYFDGKFFSTIVIVESSCEAMHTKGWSKDSFKNNKWSWLMLLSKYRSSNHTKIIRDIILCEDHKCYYQHRKV